MAKGLSVSLFTGARRRLGGVRSVSAGAVNRPIPQSEFVETCRRFQQEAARSRDMHGVVEGLWKSEGFATTFGKRRLPENTLNDPRIPRESLPVLHVGYGAATTEHARFDAGKLEEIFEEKCAPDYRPFSVEGIGSVLRIYEPGSFKFMCAMVGLIPRGAPPGPAKDGFFAEFLSGFPPESQRLIAHGYGRLIAFSRFGIAKALDEALELPDERIEPAVHGIAFAFAMMNSEDMPRILDNSAIDYPNPARAAFQNGLVYALVFCEWFTPGFLSAWQPQGRLESELIELARAESARNLERGRPLAFRLENPR